MRALITLLLTLLVAGCAAGKGDGAGSVTTQEKTTANGTEETTVYKEETTVLVRVEGLPEPPDSTLSYGEWEVKGMLGSYCWFSDNSGGCADSSWPLIPSKQKTLTVPPDSEMVFHFGGQNPPTTVEARTYPLNKLKKTRMFRPDRTLKAYGSGVQRTIRAELPSGEYVLEVFVKGQQGDASYYFRIMVE